jgi:KDEL-tailed cysteine endopeptidase
MFNLCKMAVINKFLDCDTIPNTDLTAEFLQHIDEHGLSYGTQEEFDFRLSLYTQADQEIKELNAMPENTFTVGHNFMSTWTKEEYKKLLGRKGRKPKSEPAQPEEITEPLAAEVDWRTKGVINKVKDQAQCGSCWAFAATCVVESYHAISTGKLLSLSEQQVVDCDTRSQGCNGGLAQLAFGYLEKNAQVAESAYPYKGRDESCKHEQGGLVKVKTHHDVAKDSGAHLKAAIMKQPIAVSVEADKSAFQRYKHGVLNSRACGTDTDHAITAVGYGTDASNG